MRKIYPDPCAWRRWFAWRPVTVNPRELAVDRRPALVWLEYVERRLITGVGFWPEWEYRFPTGDICPCCNRSFENLWEHMTMEHFGFSKPVDPA